MRAEDPTAATVVEAPASIPSGRLQKRADFLRVGKGRRWHGTAMTIQAETRDPAAAAAPARFGFTLTRKVGNAVVRNRARRRLREAVRLAPADLPARLGHDYVIVGRLEALRLPFEALRRELARGLAAVHERGKRPRSDSNGPAGRGPERTRHES